MGSQAKILVRAVNKLLWQTWRYKSQWRTFKRSVQAKREKASLFVYSFRQLVFVSVFFFSEVRPTLFFCSLPSCFKFAARSNNLCNSWVVCYGFWPFTLFLRSLPSYFKYTARLRFLAFRQHQLIKQTDFKLCSQTSWRYWGYENFVKKPASWAVTNLVTNPLSWTYQRLTGADQGAIETSTCCYIVVGVLKVYVHTFHFLLNMIQTLACVSNATCKQLHAQRIN